MPTSSSVREAFLVALKALLVARPGLAGVGVFLAHPGDELPPEALFVDRVTTEQEWAALGRLRRDEAITAFVVCHVIKAGAGEEVATAARARLDDLQAELEDALRTDPSVSGTVRQAAYVRDELRQGTGANGRWASLEGQVVAQARI
jgi:hypothetical protein